MSKGQHVVPYGNQWAVRSEGHTKVSNVYPTQQQAVKSARIISSTKANVVIHGKDGRIRNKNTNI